MRCAWENKWSFFLSFFFHLHRKYWFKLFTSTQNGNASGDPVPEGRNNENWTLYLEGSCLLQLPLRFSFLSAHEKADNNIILVIRICKAFVRNRIQIQIRTYEIRSGSKSGSNSFIQWPWRCQKIYFSYFFCFKFYFFGWKVKIYYNLTLQLLISVHSTPSRVDGITRRKA